MGDASGRQGGCVVVVGTGTGVGKTYVSVALVTAWRKLGVSAIGLKPVETGVEPGREAETDARRLKEAAGTDGGAGVEAEGGLFHVKHPVETASPPGPPHRFVPPISPHLAARQAGTAIHLSALRAWTLAHPRPLLVETAGALFSPLSPSATNFDFVLALEPCQLLLVAADRLGVLHDLTVTLALMRARGRGPDAIVLSAPAPDTSTGTNAGELASLGIARVDAVFPHGPSSPGDPALAAAERVLRRLGAIVPAAPSPR